MKHFHPNRVISLKSMQRTALMLALTSLLSLPIMSMAADVAMDEHSGHHPDQAQTAAQEETPAATERMQAMRARMMEIRAGKDPEILKQLMAAQMKDMETMMQDGSCPMMAGGKGGMGMTGQGMSGPDDMMKKRMDMMEKRMDMMQMMMQMRMGQGGMGTPAQ